MDSWPVIVGDVIVIAVTLLSAVLALARGFLREVLSVVGWIAAALMAFWLFPYAQPIAQDLIASEMIANIAAGAAVFIGALIVFTTISLLVSRAVQGSIFAALDRSLGFVFGAIRGAFIVSLAYLVLAFLVPNPDDHPAWVQEARTLPFIQQGAAFIAQFIPGDLLQETTEAAQTQTGAFAQSAGALAVQHLLAPPAPAQDSPDADGEAGYSASDRAPLDRLIEAGAAVTNRP